MLIQLQPYDFKLEYKLGDKLFIADRLPRAVNGNVRDFDSFDEEVESHLFYVTKEIPITDRQLLRFKKEIQKDQILSSLMNIIKEGFPENKKVLKTELRIFWPFRDELTIVNNLIFKGDKLLVPVTLRQEMLQRLHVSHLGREKTKIKARELIFWPQMSKDIDIMIEHCEICSSYRNENCKEPLHPHELPKKPWEKVGTDLFQYKNENYLIIVDYYSKFPEICLLKTTSSKDVINHMKSVFARHGIPTVVMSDNGPQYISKDFKDFAISYNFRHITSSPRYPQSNGFVERSIQSIKNMMKKCENSDLYLGLLELRNTPINNNLPSPAQLLFSRRLRGIIPMTEKMLYPKLQNRKQIQSKFVERQNKAKYYYDKGTKVLSDLKAGQRVKVLNFYNKKWYPGYIVKQQGIRSYKIEMEGTNKILIRNRKHLISVPQSDEVVEREKRENKENAVSTFGREIKIPNRLEVNPYCKTYD